MKILLDTHDSREAIQKSVESINTNLLTKGMELYAPCLWLKSVKIIEWVC